jgi:hypothetical protein
VYNANGGFHHIRPVPTITDAIATQCKNHFQIVAAERVPASRGGARCFEKNPSICYLKTKKEEIDPLTPQFQQPNRRP